MARVSAPGYTCQRPRFEDFGAEWKLECYRFAKGLIHDSIYERIDGWAQRSEKKLPGENRSHVVRMMLTP